jgi:L-rhamnose isomerase
MDNYIPFFLVPFIGWGVRHYLIKRNDYSTLKKITLAIGISAYFVTEMARSFYRPYIYANHIDDWVIADTIGNSLGTVTAVFMIITMSGKGTNRDWGLVALVIAGLIGYEMLNIIGDHPFDVNDVLATILFGGISVLVYARILARHGKQAAPRE